MMWIFSAILIGLAGSFHCVGMCGPLMLALPGGRTLSPTFVAGRSLYHLGRSVSYAMLGLLFGLFGQGISLIGLQRILAILLGIAVLIAVFIPQWENKLTQLPLFKKIFQGLRKSLGKALQSQHFPTLFNTGILNGFLPCGMVYLALAGAIAMPELWQSIAFMGLFGLGTLPAMLGLSIAGTFLPRERINKIKPVLNTIAMIVILLLIIRGLDLGIPYLSPSVEVVGEVVDCH